MALSKKRSSSKKTMKRSSSKKGKRTRVKVRRTRVKGKQTKVNRKRPRVNKNKSRKTKKRTMKGGEIVRFNIKIVHNGTYINLTKPFGIKINVKEDIKQAIDKDNHANYETLNLTKEKALKIIIKDFVETKQRRENKIFNINRIIVLKNSSTINVYVSENN